MKTAIFYFSGTGNSLMVAKTIAKRLGNSEVISIPKVNDYALDTDYNRLGLVFPVYWGGLPFGVLRFIPELKKHQENYLFAIATHAGGPGLVLSQLRAEIEKVGLNLHAGFRLAMPSNYILSYSAPSQQSIQTALNCVDKVIPNIVDIIRNKKVHQNKSDFPNFSQTTKNYQQFIKDVNASDVKFWVDENCTECGICERICPVHNIALEEGQPQWLHRCEQCLACINWCPEKAIQYGTRTAAHGRYTNPRITVEDLEYPIFQ